MTDKEKLLKLRKLADAMYYAAQYLTTDASMLHKAMDEFHQFIINEYHKTEPTIPDIVDEHFYEMLGEEPVSDELKEASKEWLQPQLDKSYANYGEGKMMELTHFDGYAMLDAIEYGAKWQKQQMMSKAIVRKVKVDAGGYPYIDTTELYDYNKDIPLAKEGDKVKVIVIKED